MALNTVFVNSSEFDIDLEFMKLQM